MKKRLYLTVIVLAVLLLALGGLVVRAAVAAPRGTLGLRARTA